MLSALLSSICAYGALLLSTLRMRHISVLGDTTMGQAQGRELPFDIGDTHSCLTGKTVWTAHDGKRKVDHSVQFLEGSKHRAIVLAHCSSPQSDGEPVTVFLYDFTRKTEEEVRMAPPSPTELP